MHKLLKQFWLIESTMVFLTGDSADLGVASAPPAQEPEYDKLSDEVMTTSESAPKGVPVDHVDLVAKTRRAVKMWRCKLCGRLYGRRASLLMHLMCIKGLDAFLALTAKFPFIISEHLLYIDAWVVSKGPL